MRLTHAQFLAKGHGKTGPWIDLVNSEEWDTYGQRTDWLDDPSWPNYFLRQWHFAAPGREPFPATQFKELRAALRKSCESLLAGGTVPDHQLRALNYALSVAGRRQLIQRQNRLQVEFVGEPHRWTWILAQTAFTFALLLSRGEETRVKICLNPDCRWVFYDATKGKTRRWCSDKVCGNRERVRRARARAAR